MITKLCKNGCKFLFYNLIHTESQNKIGRINVCTAVWSDSVVSVPAGRSKLKSDLESKT